jgi:hypothetical protein
MNKYSIEVERGGDAFSVTIVSETIHIFVSCFYIRSIYKNAKELWKEPHPDSPSIRQPYAILKVEKENNIMYQTEVPQIEQHWKRAEKEEFHGERGKTFTLTRKVRSRQQHNILLSMFLYRSSSFRYSFSDQDSFITTMIFCKATSFT